MEAAWFLEREMSGLCGDTALILHLGTRQTPCSLVIAILSYPHDHNRREA